MPAVPECMHQVPIAMAFLTIKHTKRMGRAFVSTKRIAKGTVLLECQATGNSVVLLDHLVGERCDVCLADTATKPCGNKSCAAVLCATCKRSPQHASVCGAASREPVLVRSLLRLAAAERADGAVAKQLDALENHHDAYGPERRDAFKAAAARAPRTAAATRGASRATRRPSSRTSLASPRRIGGGTRRWSSARRASAAASSRPRRRRTTRARRTAIPSSSSRRAAPPSCV